MVKYITYREKDEYERLCFFILQKDFPHYIGLLVTKPVEGALINVPISNYNLWITFYGTLRGNFVPAQKGIIAEISEVFYSMASWYYFNRVQGVKKFEKFKIKYDNSSTTG